MFNNFSRLILNNARRNLNYYKCFLNMSGRGLLSWKFIILGFGLVTAITNYDKFSRIPDGDEPSDEKIGGVNNSNYKNVNKKVILNENSVYLFGKLSSMGDKTRENLQKIDLPFVPNKLSIGNQSIILLSPDGLLYEWKPSNGLNQHLPYMRFKDIHAGDDGMIVAVQKNNTIECRPPDSLKWEEMDFGRTLFSDPKVPKKVSVGIEHAIVLFEDGSVCTWGKNRYGQLGIVRNEGYSSQVNRIDFPSEIVDVAAGGYHSLAIDQQGLLYSFGYNKYNQLGLEQVWPVPLEIETPTSNAPVPKLDSKYVGKVKSLETLAMYSETPLAIEMYSKPQIQVVDYFKSKKINLKKAWASDFGSFVQDAQGRIYSFGEGTSGRLGNGISKTFNLPKPNRVGTFRSYNNEPFNHITCGSKYCIGTTEKSRNVYAWGMTLDGELGDESVGIHTKTIPIFQKAPPIKLVDCFAESTAVLF